ncbi:cell division protein FtsX [Acetobacter sp. AN02]|uniref:cell division protein FtsX n=1 Tax=Acetobacter sp. AN02 TaxID=2894186 RepID=UPI002434133A|nr:cell division protein FtsX [Acetobacter sp. AN02]MDG6094408.1 cell division protein FtsX [Acetobacter sp. AN02]
MSDARNRRDGLALAGALPDRTLIAMIAAMAFLASLTLAGALGARSLSLRWAAGAAGLVTVQVPQPDNPASAPPSETATGKTRAEAALALLGTLPETMSVRRLSATELDTLLRPWLGVSGTAALPLPAVIEVHMHPGTHLDAGQETALRDVAPGTLIERNDEWRGRLAGLAGSLELCAALALAAVSFVAVAVTGMATRLGLGVRRDAVGILHGLGAADGYIAGRFGTRLGALGLAGGLAGVICGFPVLTLLYGITAPLYGGDATLTASVDQVRTLILGGLPRPVLIGLGIIPLIAMCLGWSTARIIVRLWLRRLP